MLREQPLSTNLSMHLQSQQQVAKMTCAEWRVFLPEADASYV